MKAADKLATVSQHSMKKSSFRMSFLVVVLTFIASQLLVSSSARSYEKGLSCASLSGGAASLSSNSSRREVKVFDADSHRLLNHSNLTLSPVSFSLAPQLGGSGIATFSSDCTVPKTDFILSDIVCAKATGLTGFRLAFVDPAGFIEQSTDITTDPQTFTFTLPTTDQSVINGYTVDNRGEWRVNAITSRNSVKTSAFFTVTDPQNATVDLSITKTLVGGDTPVEGGPVQFSVTITNQGPDTASNVHFVDDTFSNATFGSVTQTDGLPFVCSGTSSADCTIASFPQGSVAKFLLTFTAGTAGGNLQNTATVSSSTAEQNAQDNSFTTPTFRVGSSGTPPACQLQCPDNINANADTTENNQRGTHVFYDNPTAGGTCGTVSYDHPSGSFFPVGTTTVTATSTQGNGSCSFTVTVVDQGSPPTISCPANQTADADNNCQANVNVGTATTTGGTNVTVIGTRSDGKPMYTCDANGTNCTRNSSDAPFSAGTTTITWIAYSHDTPGPYASAADEEAHRTGSASCTQTVTVNDVTPPTIGATDQTVSADANCQATVPDYSTTVTDNCACTSSDNSESCAGHARITVTQVPAAGTVVGPGQYPVVITANDGSSNNGGAGNTSTKTITLTVADQTAPTITCPANITQNTDPNQCSAVVTYSNATATDNCSGVGTPSCTPPSGSTFPKGTTTVTCTVSDASNNSASCTFTVTVNDTQPPTITCPANITKSTDPNQCSAVVTFSATVSDNCPGATYTCNPPSGSTFQKGTTTVTCTATDTSNNTASCQFTVTVNDTQPPSITCPANKTVEPTCPAGAVVTYPAPVVSDNCPGVSFVCSPASGSTFAIGTTTVTCTATDTSANTTSCSFTVKVETPQEVIQDLINRVQALMNQGVLNQNQGQGLTNTLQQALDALNAGSSAGACGKLAQFINKVQTFIQNGTLTSAQGQPLIDSANRVINTLGCTNNPCT